MYVVFGIFSTPFTAISPRFHGFGPRFHGFGPRFHGFGPVFTEIRESSALFHSGLKERYNIADDSLRVGARKNET